MRYSNFSNSDIDLHYQGQVITFSLAGHDAIIVGVILLKLIKG